MGVIFISHSSKDNAQALRVRDWLRDQGWQETFLDLDPMHGLAPGQKWQEELKKAGERCAAVVVLVSPNWAGSKWCLTEFLLASQLGKRIFPVIIAPTPFQDLPIELTAHFQLADISEPAKETDGFDRLRIGLKRAGLDPRDFPWPPPGQPGRSPYRGLRTLEEEDAAIFFGRDAAITSGLDELRKMRSGSPKRMLVVLGASGAGKSSFLRAGLMSRLRRDSENFLVLPIFRPERAALTGASGLLRALGVGVDATDEALAARLAELRAPVVANFTRLAEAAHEKWEGRPPTIALPIDQGEELFAAENTEASAAIALLARAFASDPDLVAVLTIRSDSFEQLQAAPVLGGIARQPFDLPRLSPGAFKDVIEGPGRLATPPVQIAPALTDRLVSDLDAADALPLLAFTLERLVADHGADGTLELQEYEQGLGGLSGAIGKAVETAFAAAQADPSLPNERADLEALARAAFIPWLVRIDDVESAPKRRAARLSELPEQSRALIQKFIDQRLLVSDAPSGGEATVEVSHEAVLRNWSLLAAWIAGERETLSRAEAVVRAATEWSAAEGGDRGQLLVHRGDRLARATALLERPDIKRFLGTTPEQYLNACAAQERSEAERERGVRRGRQFLQTIVAMLVVVAAVVTATGGWFVINGQRSLGRAQSLMLARTAEQALQSGDVVRAFHLAALASRDEFLGPATPEGRAQLASGAQSINQVTQVTHDGPVAGAVFSKEENRILTWSTDKTARLWDAATGKQVGPAFTHDGSVLGAVFSKDESRILTWSTDNTARLWDAATGKQVGSALTHDDRVNGAVFSKDESRILTWSTDKTARLWDAATGKQVGPALTHDGWVSGAVFSKDESRILTWSDDKTARLWDAATGKQVGPALTHDDRVNGAVFSKDESRILTWSGDKTARLWDAATDKQVGPALTHDGSVLGAVFSKDDSRILTWSWDGAARLWDAATGKQVGPALTHDGWVSGAVFSKDESRILTWSGDKTTRLWDAATGKQVGPALTHDNRVNGAVFSKDDSRILTWSDDKTARLWDAATGKQVGPALTHDGLVLGAVLSKDESRILTWSTDNTARLWDAATGKQVGSALTHDGWVSGAVFSKDESRILTWSTDNTARLWDSTTGKQVGPALTHDDRVNGAVFSKDESRILTWSTDKTARLWDAATGKQVGPALTHDGWVSGAVFSKDESRILTWSDDKTARLWDAATGKQVGPALTHDDRVNGAVFSKDESRILTWSGDKTTRLWDAATGKQVGPALTHDGSVNGAVFSKDENRILTWSTDKTARLWDAAAGRQIGPALTHDDSVNGAVFSKDDSRILTWSEDKMARLWDSATGKQVGPALTHDDRVNGAVFSKDDSRILTWSTDKTARLWDAATGKQVGPALTHDGSVLGAVFSKDESRILTWSEDNTARLWDAATGKQVGPALTHDGWVSGAVFSKDESRILTWSGDKTTRLWDVRRAITTMSSLELTRDVCQANLAGARTLDAKSIELAPILRGREGEDICAWSPPWYDGILRTLLGWAFP